MEPNKISEIQKGRFKGESLPQDRKDAIKDNMAALLSNISITDNIFLAELLSKGAIDQVFYESLLASPYSSEEKAKKILEYIMKGINDQYDTLCHALMSSKQVICVKNYLTTKDDKKMAQLKLAQFYDEDFTEIRLYTRHREEFKVSLPTLYVPTTWYRYDKKENLKTYFEIFSKIVETGDTRVVVDGDPGSGKSTFVKRICHAWSQIILGKPIDLSKYEGLGHLRDFDFVIPLLLRLVCIEGMTLTDLLRVEIGTLHTTEICALLNFLQETPEKCLFLMDGYDEFVNDDNEIHEIISRKTYKQSKCITTTRPHAMNRLRRLPSNVMAQHLHLCGFNQSQILQYITQYFTQYLNDPTQIDKLWNELTCKRKDLLDIASVPIHTEIICIVWNAFKELGRNQAELYMLLLLHLFDHNERKWLQGKYLLSPQSLEDYKYVLLPMANLANSWEPHGRLKINFGQKELQQTLGESFSAIVATGVITNVVTTGHFDFPVWSFTHMTLQEYLVAYSMSKCSNILTTQLYLHSKHSIYVLERSEKIFEFLIHFDKGMAENLLKQLTKETTETAECQSLLRFVMWQMVNGNIAPEMCIPLPKIVDVSVYSNNFPLLDQLLDQDDLSGMQNLEILYLTDIVSLPSALGKVYLKELYIKITNRSEFRHVEEGLPQMISLQKLSVDFSEIRHVANSVVVADMIDSIPTNCLKSLTLKGRHIVSCVDKTLLVSRKLEFLEIEDDRRLNSTKDYLSFCSATDCCSSLQEIYLRVALQKSFDLFLKIRKEINVHVFLLQPEPSDLDAFTNSDIHASTECPKMVSFGITNTLFHADIVSKIAQRPNLQNLKVEDCLLTPREAHKIVSHLNSSKKNWAIKNLDLSGTVMSNFSGVSVILTVFKLASNLTILLLANCKLNNNDFSDIAASMNLLPQLQTLDIYGALLGTEKGGVVKFLLKLPNLQNLRIGGSGSIPGPTIKGAITAGGLQELKVLEMEIGGIIFGFLHQISRHLKTLRKLVAFDISQKEKASTNLVTDKRGYINIFREIPSSVAYLNMFNRRLKPNPFEILDFKENLASLHSLNIWVHGDELKMLREQLETINPNIKVYCDPQESLWTKFITQQVQLHVEEHVTLESTDL